MLSQTQARSRRSFRPADNKFKVCDADLAAEFGHLGKLVGMPTKETIETAKESREKVKDISNCVYRPFFSTKSGIDIVLRFDKFVENFAKGDSRGFPC